MKEEEETELFLQHIKTKSNSSSLGCLLEAHGVERLDPMGGNTGSSLTSTTYSVSPRAILLSSLSLSFLNIQWKGYVQSPECLPTHPHQPQPLPLPWGSLESVLRSQTPGGEQSPLWPAGDRQLERRWGQKNWSIFVVEESVGCRQGARNHWHHHNTWNKPLRGGWEPQGVGRVTWWRDGGPESGPRGARTLERERGSWALAVSGDWQPWIQR